MIKVLHIIPALEVIGGAEKLATEICINLDKKKFTTSIVTFYSTNNNTFIEKLKKNNIKIISLDKKIGFDLSIIFKLYKVFKEYKPDIINTHLDILPYVILPAILRKIKVKVHTVHSIASKEISSKFRKKIVGFAYKHLKYIPIGICDHVKKSIQEEYNLKSYQVQCIYNGVDTDKFICNKEYIFDKKAVFINVGRMSKAKNQILLIEAFKLVSEQNKNIRLHIIGDGELRKTIEKKIKELDLENIVILKGIRNNIAKELNNASVFVLSSDYEGLPLSVLEAMSSGLPIISTNAGGVIDIVENNVNGIIVEKRDKQKLANAMIKISKDKNKMEEMGRNSYLLSKKYTLRQMVKKYEDLYIDLLKKRKDKDERKRKN